MSLSRAWRCWTTSTATGSSGTTSGATTRSRSSARTWRAISSLPDRPSPISASPEGISNLQSSLCCYLLFVLFMTLLIIQQWKADQVGTIPKYDKGKYTFSKSLKTLIKVEYIQILNMANKTNIWWHNDVFGQRNMIGSSFTYMASYESQQNVKQGPWGVSSIQDLWNMTRIGDELGHLMNLGRE